MNLKQTCYDIMDAIPQLWHMVEIKTQEMLYRQLRSYALELFRGEIDGNEFLTLFERTITNQLTKAWYEGALESDVFPQDMGEDDLAELQRLINDEMEYVFQLGDDIIILARTGTIENFRTQIGSRLDMWANRYNEVANRAKLWFGGKQKYIWVLGETEQHCTTCAALNGIVAWAEEWLQAKVTPGEADSKYLECGGWRCDCRLDSVGRGVRRTNNALVKILEITGQSSKSVKYPEGGHWVTINGDHVYIDKDGNPVNAPYLEKDKDKEEEKEEKPKEENVIIGNPDIPKHYQDAYREIPESIRNAVPVPKIYIGEPGDNRFQFGRLYIDPSEPNVEYADAVFVHEFGHYADSMMHYSDSPAMDELYKNLQENAGNLSYIENPISYTAGAIYNQVVDIATGGANGGQWSAEYLARNGKKELFATALQSQYYVSSKFNRAFPDVVQYINNVGK